MSAEIWARELHTHNMGSKANSSFDRPCGVAKRLLRIFLLVAVYCMRFRDKTRSCETAFAELDGSFARRPAEHMCGGAYENKNPYVGPQNGTRTKLRDNDSIYAANIKVQQTIVAKISGMASSRRPSSIGSLDDKPHRPLNHVKNLRIPDHSQNRVQLDNGKTNGTILTVGREYVSRGPAIDYLGTYPSRYTGLISTEEHWSMSSTALNQEWDSNWAQIGSLSFLIFVLRRQ